MKKILLLAFAATMMASCTKTEMPSDEPSRHCPLTITVTDNGYTSADKTQTRAIDADNTTKFAAGDKLGLYAVKVDGTYALQNVCLTAVNVDNKLVWQLPVEAQLFFDEVEGGKYFAYYPYQDTPNGTLDATKSTSAEFFADVISKWTPATDQSTAEKYTSSDLMVGDGVIGPKSENNTYAVALTMTHAMALMIIELPATKYDLQNTNMASYEITVSNEFQGFKPRNTSLATHRYLVKPNQLNANNLTGSYVHLSGDTKEYVLAQNNLVAAQYIRYKVDGGVVNKKHTLYWGDFYLRDGSLINASSTMTAEQKEACIGLVYWLGTYSWGNVMPADATLLAHYPTCTHGLVVSLKDDGSSKWQEKDKVVQEWLDANRKNEFLPLQSGAYGNVDKIQGYNNTKAIEAFNAANADGIVLVTQKLAAFRQAVPTPKGSSGWYLPSEKELSLLCGKDIYYVWGTPSSPNTTESRDRLNPILERIGAEKLSGEYWASNESTFFKAFYLSFIHGGAYAESKDRVHSIRYTLSF